MLAVFKALKPDLRGHHVLVRSDNTSLVSNIRGVCGRSPYTSWLPRSFYCSGNDTKVWAGASDNTQVMNLIFSRDDISNRV